MDHNLILIVVSSQQQLVIFSTFVSLKLLKTYLNLNFQSSIKSWINKSGSAWALESVPTTFYQKKVQEEDLNYSQTVILIFVQDKNRQKIVKWRKKFILEIFIAWKKYQQLFAVQLMTN